MALALSSLNASMALHSRNRHPIFANSRLPRHSPAIYTVAFACRRNQNSAVSSSSKKNKNSLASKEDGADEDAFEALFSMLEEDLKNDELSLAGDNNDDDDDDFNEEDLEKLQRELEEALGIAVDDDDDNDVEMLNSDADLVEIDDDDEEEEEKGRTLKLKNWQLRRLASALKTGRRKTSIKNLAADLCLDRVVVLDLLRNPPPSLVMMSAALPDKPAPVVSAMTPARPIEAVTEEATAVDVIKSENQVKIPVHFMQQSWSAQKRLKKAQVDALERVYRRTKRPTNAMISSIVQVTNLPRKRIVEWFEDKRTEDGVPDHHVPYQRSKPESLSSC